MLRSDSRILTTHVGSLPCNPVLTELRPRQEQGLAFEAPELELAMERAVQYVVGKQLEAGIAPREGARRATGRLS